MKKSIVLAMAGLIAFTGSSVEASAVSLLGPRPMVLPVLVRVTAKGEVTDISPARELTPRFDHLLHADMRALQVVPATYHGRSVSKQVVINLALKFEPREDGRYRARFAYVSTTPVPSGQWYWVHLDNHRLGLAQRGAFTGGPAMRFGREPERMERRSGLWGAPRPQVFRSRTSTTSTTVQHSSGTGH